jgi:hypothetical protein
MSTIEKNVELEEAVRFATTGKADPEILRKIHEDAARIREELRRKYGKTNLAVPLIREIREE